MEFDFVNVSLANFAFSRLLLFCASLQTKPPAIKASVHTNRLRAVKRCIPWPSFSIPQSYLKLLKTKYKEMNTD